MIYHFANQVETQNDSSLGNYLSQLLISLQISDTSYTSLSYKFLHFNILRGGTVAVSNYELNQIISVCLKNQEAKSKAIHSLLHLVNAN